MTDSPTMAGHELPTIGNLKSCADRHLNDYTSPSGHRAFVTYDRCDNPRTFAPLDALAPGFLDAPVRGRYVINMFRSDASEEDPYVILREKLEKVVQAEVCHRTNFLDLNLTDDDAWQLVCEALSASERQTDPHTNARTAGTLGIKSGIVSKMLHRKIPDLVPIFDSKVRRFYGIPYGQRDPYWATIQSDWIANSGLISSWAGGRLTPDGRTLSLLRTADIVIWQHVVTGCQESPTPS